MSGWEDSFRRENSNESSDKKLLSKHFFSPELEFFRLKFARFELLTNAVPLFN